MPKNDKKEQKMAEKSRKDNKKQTKKVLKIPNPPEYFVGYSLKKWNELAPIFAEKNMLGDADSIAGYLAGKNSQTMGEYLAYHKAITAYHKMLTEFGLTPASKKKVSTPEVIEEDDPLEKMING